MPIGPQYIQAWCSGEIISDDMKEWERKPLCKHMNSGMTRPLTDPGSSMSLLIALQLDDSLLFEERSRSKCTAFCDDCASKTTYNTSSPLRNVPPCTIPSFVPEQPLPQSLHHSITVPFPPSLSNTLTYLTSCCRWPENTSIASFSHAPLAHPRR